MADAQSKPPQQTLEMRVAALEDKLSQQRFSEEELRTYMKVAAALAAQGSAPQASTGHSGFIAPCGMPPAIGAIIAPCAIPPGVSGIIAPCAVPHHPNAIIAPCTQPPTVGFGFPLTSPCAGIYPCTAPPAPSGEATPGSTGTPGTDPTGTAGGFGSLGR